MKRLVEQEAFPRPGKHTRSGRCSTICARGVWSEVGSGDATDAYRRNLQRAYLDRMKTLMWNDNADGVRCRATFARGQLMTLKAELEAAVDGVSHQPTQWHFMDAIVRIEMMLDPANKPPPGEGGTPQFIFPFVKGEGGRAVVAGPAVSDLRPGIRPGGGGLNGWSWGSVARSSENRTLLSLIEAEYGRYSLLGERAMRQVEPEEIHERSGRGNSIATIVWHLAGNLESRFTDFPATDGEKPWRDRDAEFEVRDVSAEEVVERWEEGGWGVLFDALRGLTDGDLSARVTIRGVPFRGRRGLAAVAGPHRVSRGADRAAGQGPSRGDEWGVSQHPAGRGRRPINANPVLEKSSVPASFDPPVVDSAGVREGALRFVRKPTVIATQASTGAFSGLGGRKAGQGTDRQHGVVHRPGSRTPGDPLPLYRARLVHEEVGDGQALRAHFVALARDARRQGVEDLVGVQQTGRNDVEFRIGEDRVDHDDASLCLRVDSRGREADSPRSGAHPVRLRGRHGRKLRDPDRPRHPGYGHDCGREAHPHGKDASGTPVIHRAAHLLPPGWRIVSRAGPAARGHAPRCLRPRSGAGSIALSTARLNPNPQSP